MKPQEVRETLLQTLAEIQQLSGRPVPTFSDSLCPAEDLEGFDSQNAEEAAAMLEQQLGCEINKNLFVSENEDRRLQIGEIVEVLCQLLNGRSKKA